MKASFFSKTAAFLGVGSSRNAEGQNQGSGGSNLTREQELKAFFISPLDNSHTTPTAFWQLPAALGASHDSVDTPNL